MYDFIYVHIFALCQNRAAEWSGVVFRKVKNYGRKFNFMIFAHEYKHAIKYWKKLLLCVFFLPLIVRLTSNLFPQQILMALGNEDVSSLMANVGCWSHWLPEKNMNALYFVVRLFSA